ncbi:MAG: M24 family metallopeptidase [Candidatus Thorarchaeota archaeon]
MRFERVWSFIFLVLPLLLSSQFAVGATSYQVSEKQPMELASMSVSAAEAASITSNALQEAWHVLRNAYASSITQADILQHLEASMRAEGADGALAFPTLVMSGSELSMAHGDPYDDETHVITPSTEPIVMIDIGCKYHGHSSDVTRTFFFESATQDMKDAYAAVLEAEEGIIEAIAPGVVISDLDAIMRSLLSDYVGLDNVSLLTYWGHGVGRYVHEMPILGNVDGQLEADDVLAIEPGLYFDDGWAVRVEDTVLVTDTGCEILSDVPKTLDEVTITQTQPLIEGAIDFSDYIYGRTTNVVFTYSDSANRNATSVDLHDGYVWTTMNKESDNQYSYSFLLNLSHSSRVTYSVRLHLSNDTYYFTQIQESEAVAYDSEDFDPAIHINAESLPPDSPLIWTFARTGAKMIRLRFEVIDGGSDQLLIKDSNSRVFADYRYVHDQFLWTPWISGDELRIHVVATEPDFLGGVDAFRFTVDRMQYIIDDIPQTTVITTPEPVATTTLPISSSESSTTTTTSEIPPPNSSFPVALVLTAMFGVAALVIVCGVGVMKVKSL